MLDGEGSTGKGAAFELTSAVPSVGNLTTNFAPCYGHLNLNVQRTGPFEFNRAEYWVLNSCSRRRHLRKLKSKIVKSGKCVTMACNYYIFIMQYCYSFDSISYSV